MQPTDMTNVRLLFRAEMDRLSERLREFGTEVQRQEDSLRALYPWLAKAFRASTTPASGSNDNAKTTRRRDRLTAHR
jgi:hypothetical protein